MSEVTAPEGPKVFIGLEAGASTLQEAYRMGNEAGHCDDRLQYPSSYLPKMTNKTYDEFARGVSAAVANTDHYVENYYKELRELARARARQFVILLTKVSDEAADKLYKGCEGENIKFVKARRFEEFVDEVVSEDLFNSALLNPVLQSFWNGWRVGCMLHATWSQLAVNHKFRPKRVVKRTVKKRKTRQNRA